MTFDKADASVLSGILETNSLVSSEKVAPTRGMVSADENRR